MFSAHPIHLDVRAQEPLKRFYFRFVTSDYLILRMNTIEFGGKKTKVKVTVTSFLFYSHDGFISGMVEGNFFTLVKNIQLN